jgi:hypothetical protein
MVRSVGVTAIDSSDAGVTVKEAEPEMAAAAEVMVLVSFVKEAVIVVVPGDRAVARPRLPSTLLMLATVVSDEVQVTSSNVVKSCVVPSAKSPVAVNWCVVPSAISGMGGVTSIAAKTCLSSIVIDSVSWISGTMVAFSKILISSALKALTMISRFVPFDTRSCTVTAACCSAVTRKLCVIGSISGAWILTSNLETKSGSPGTCRS